MAPISRFFFPFASPSYEPERGPDPRSGPESGSDSDLDAGSVTRFSTDSFATDPQGPVQGSCPDFSSSTSVR